MWAVFSGNFIKGLCISAVLHVLRKPEFTRKMKISTGSNRDSTENNEANALNWNELQNQAIII